MKASELINELKKQIGVYGDRYIALRVNRYQKEDEQYVHYETVSLGNNNVGSYLVISDDGKWEGDFAK